MGSAFKIDVKQGGSFNVMISGKEDDLNDLEYGVSKGTLRIGYKNNGWKKSRETVQISVTMPSLDGVDFSGASVAKVGGFERGKGMAINVSGASKVEMDFSADKVFVDLSGASRLTLTGRAETLQGEMSGASTFEGKDFPVKEADLEASGASKASGGGQLVPSGRCQRSQPYQLCGQRPRGPVQLVGSQLYPPGKLTLLGPIQLEGYLFTGLS